VKIDKNEGKMQSLSKHTFIDLKSLYLFKLSSPFVKQDVRFLTCAILLFIPIQKELNEGSNNLM